MKSVRVANWDKDSVTDSNGGFSLNMRTKNETMGGVVKSIESGEQRQQTLPHLPGNRTTTENLDISQYDGDHYPAMRYQGQESRMN